MILYKKNIPLKRIKYKQYPSFESITVIFGSYSNQPAITNVYYPGYSAKHKFLHTAFLANFEELCNNELIGYENIIMVILIFTLKYLKIRLQ